MFTKSLVYGNEVAYFVFPHEGFEPLSHMIFIPAWLSIRPFLRNMRYLIYTTRDIFIDIKMKNVKEKLIDDKIESWVTKCGLIDDEERELCFWFFTLVTV